MRRRRTHAAAANSTAFGVAEHILRFRSLRAQHGTNSVAGTGRRVTGSRFPPPAVAVPLCVRVGLGGPLPAGCAGFLSLVTPALASTRPGPAQGCDGTGDPPHRTRQGSWRFPIFHLKWFFPSPPCFFFGFLGGFFAFGVGFFFPPLA